MSLVGFTFIFVKSNKRKCCNTLSRLPWSSSILSEYHLKISFVRFSAFSVEVAFTLAFISTLIFHCVFRVVVQGLLPSLLSKTIVVSASFRFFFRAVLISNRGPRSAFSVQSDMDLHTESVVKIVSYAPISVTLTLSLIHI